jgi:ribonuclease BN (tRNA processing enzyme)
MKRLVALALGMLAVSGTATAAVCPETGVQLQVMGAGGAAVESGRAGPGYLLWVQGKPRVLVDAGGGVALRLADTGARSADLDVVLLSQLHATHTAGFAALVQAVNEQGRTRPLPVYGPSGNRSMPHTIDFVRALFDPNRGVYRHLGDILNPLAKGAWRLDPHDVREKPRKLGVARKPEDELLVAFTGPGLRAVATYVPHARAPVLAWRIETGGKSVVFAGDTNGKTERLALLAHGADLLVAHHAINESASAEELASNMPPSMIAQLARTSGARQLVLAHRAPTTRGREDETLASMRRHYEGSIALASDLDCFTP